MTLKQQWMVWYLADATGIAEPVIEAIVMAWVQSEPSTPVLTAT